MTSAAVPGPSPPARPPAPRLEAVDLLRGLVMVIMALDHARGFFSNATFYPLEVEKTNAALFFTRWFTHFCAPVFVFLAGTGAFLSTTRGKTTRELSWFLLTRGAWLMLLEVTWVRCLGWNFHFDFHSVGVAVIWAIGCSMIVLAGLVWLPVPVITVFGVVMIVSHNLFDGVAPADWGEWAGLWRLLHAGGVFEVAPGWSVGAGYPLVPWIGVMAAGHGFGRLWQWEPAARQRCLLWLGAALTAGFIAIRLANGYGDPAPWNSQPDALRSVFAFLNCQKYPPSLCYLLMTLGPAMLALAWFDRGTPRWLRPVLVFGRVPLFYYLLHLPLLHGMAVVANYLRHGHAEWLYGLARGPQPAPPPLAWTDRGFELGWVYVFWLLAVVGLYPACRWFADLKRRRREGWLSYL